MSSATHFDTHESFKRLTAVGFTDEQAEEQTRILSDLIDQRLVTRDYLDSRLKELEHRMDSRLNELEHRMDHRFAEVDRRFTEMDHRFRELEQRLTIRMGGMLVVAVGVLAVLMRVL